MFIVDDPLLALIVRFVPDSGQPDQANEDFIRTQVRALKDYVAQFPEEERGNRAMEWVQRHAKRYRRRWQTRTLARRTLYERCADCPLGQRGAEHCEIHEQWLYLLKRYMDGDVASKKYVKEALALLQEHKDQLRRRILSVTPPEPAPRPDARDVVRGKDKPRARGQRSTLAPGQGSPAEPKKAKPEGAKVKKIKKAKKDKSAKPDQTPPGSGGAPDGEAA